MHASPHLVVTIDTTRLAIAESRVDDVALDAAITETPLAPALVAGLTSRHREVVVVVDLRRALGLVERAPAAGAAVVFVDTTIGPLGLLVDEVVAPTQVDSEHLAVPPATMIAPARRIIAGVARLDDQLLAVVDVDAVAAELATPIPALA
jgi:purine-binding chemotaxis protein CheW